MRNLLYGLKSYFQEYLTANNSSEFITSKIIGNIMFELLQRDDIEYSEKTQKNIEYFKYYLNNCIENSDYCNNKVFLSCMQECASLCLPKQDIHIENIYTRQQRCDYSVINSTLDKKTNIILKNKDNIKYSKIYYCNCIEDLFICSLYELFEKGYIIRKCINCKKFFVTKEKGNRRKYCYNYSPQDNNKTCYDYMNQCKSKEKRKKDDTILLYNSITNRLRNRQSRINTTDDKTYKLLYDLYDKELTNLSITYTNMKKEIKNGKLEKSVLIDFLSNYDKDDKKNWRKKYGSSGTNKK